MVAILCLEEQQSKQRDFLSTAVGKHSKTSFCTQILELLISNNAHSYQL